MGPLSYKGFCHHTRFLSLKKALSSCDSAFFFTYVILEFASFSSAFYGDSYGYGCTNHGVVAHAEEAHHFYVSRYGRRASELSIAVHTAHGIGHAVRSRAGSHVIRMERAACAAAGPFNRLWL